MRVWVYAICRDEKPLIGYFLRHYCTFADKIIIYDGGSTDGTREEIAACPKAELRDWPGPPGIDDVAFLDFAHEQWREAIGKAEWVVWVDCDEFLYHENILGLLATYLAAGIELPQIRGFTMFSREFPTTPGQIYEQVRAGVPDDVWDKPSIFRGNMAWTMGRHSLDWTRWNPKASPTAEIKLLHYRGLGEAYVRWRHSRNWARVPEHCRVRNLGTNTSPEYVGHHSVDWFLEVMSRNLPHVV